MWVGVGYKAASCDFRCVLCAFLAEVRDERIVEFIVEFWVGGKLHLFCPSASFLRHCTALSLTGGWSSDASILRGVMSAASYGAFWANLRS